MVVIEKSLEFETPPEDVWAVVRDHSRIPLCQPFVRRVV